MKSLINLMMEKEDVNMLYVGKKAYVTAKKINEDKLISRLARESAGEAFLYDFVAKDCVNDANKVKADEILSGQYVVRFIHADRKEKDTVYSM